MKRATTNILFWLVMAALTVGLFTLLRGTPSTRILWTVAGVLACTAARVGWSHWKRTDHTSTNRQLDDLSNAVTPKLRR